MIEEAPEEANQVTTESLEAASKSKISEALANLVKFDFPKRHILKIGDMFGPGKVKAEKLLPKVLSEDCLLILYGDRGPGKTQMATWWAFKMAESRIFSIYFKAHDLLCMIRQQFSDDASEKKEAREALAMARKRKFLVIDEFSELAGSDWEKRTLTNIIDHRYDAMLATVIITNHTKKGAEEAVGRSAWTRAKETGGAVNCDWESYRV